MGASGPRSETLLLQHIQAQRSLGEAQLVSYRGARCSIRTTKPDNAQLIHTKFSQAPLIARDTVHSFP